MNDLRSKKSILIWGTGSRAKQLMKYFPQDNIEIIAFIDSDPKLQNVFYDKKVINPKKIKEYIFNFIVIASIYYAEISDYALSLGIPKEKIIYNNSLEILIKYDGKLSKDILYELYSVPYWYHSYEILHGIKTPGFCEYKPKLLD